MSFFFCPHTMMCGISYCRDTRPRVSVKTVWKQRTPREGCPYDADQEAAQPNEGVRFLFICCIVGNGLRAVPIRPGQKTGNGT